MNRTRIARAALLVLAGLVAPGISAQAFAGGDILATDYQPLRIHRITPAGAVTTVWTGAPLTAPSGCTATRDGAFVVADFNSARLYRLSPAGSLTLLAQGVPAPIRVAADLDGSFIVTDLTGGNLRRVSSGGAVSIIRPGFSRPFGVAVDPEGFYLVTEDTSGRLTRVSRDGATATVLATGLGLAAGVAVLPDGDYAVISGNPDFIRRVPRAGGGSTLLVASPPLGNPEGVVADDTAGVLVLEDGAPFGNKIVHVDGFGTHSVIAGPAAFPTGTNLECLARIPTLRGPVAPATGPGAVHVLDLDIPADAGLPFAIVAALAVYPGLPFGAPDVRRTPLQPDFVFQAALQGALAPYAVGWFGLLDGAGRAQAALDVSSLPPGALSGLSLHLQAATGSGAALSGIASVSTVLTLAFP